MARAFSAPPDIREDVREILAAENKIAGNFTISTYTPFHICLISTLLNQHQQVNISFFFFFFCVDIRMIGFDHSIFLMKFISSFFQSRSLLHFYMNFVRWCRLYKQIQLLLQVFYYFVLLQLFLFMTFLLF